MPPPPGGAGSSSSGAARSEGGYSGFFQWEDITRVPATGTGAREYEWRSLPGGLGSSNSRYMREEELGMMVMGYDNTAEGGNGKKMC